MKTITVSAAVRLICCMPMLGATLANAAGYTVQDLGEGGALDINNRGDVLLVTGSGHSAFWSNGVVTELSGLVARKLNDQGAMLGSTYQQTSDPRYPYRAIVFRAPDGTITTVTGISAIASPDSAAIALTEDNRVVAKAFNQSLLWSPQNPVGIALHTPETGPDYNVDVQSFNLNGVVGGDATQSAKNELGYKIVHLVGTINANATDPGLVTVQKYIGFSPKLINDAGQVIGTKDLFNSKQIVINTKAYFWSKATGEKSIPALFLSTATVPVDVNNSGQVVGWAKPASLSSSSQPVTPDTLPNTVGIVWSSKTGTKNLNNLIDTKSSQIKVFSAQGINASGQIVANGAVDGKKHALLLTPKP